MNQLSSESWDLLATEGAGTLSPRCGEEDQKEGEGGKLAAFCLVAMAREHVGAI